MTEKNIENDKNPKIENKLLIFIKKFLKFIWDQLAFIATDIKNASKRLSDKKNALKVDSAEVESNQVKMSASRAFKNQANDFKDFWSYLSKKSKILIFLSSAYLIFNYLPDFGPAENFLIGKCTFQKDVHKVNLKSCDLNAVRSYLDSDNDYVSFQRWHERNVWAYGRSISIGSPLNYNANSSVEYTLISANKLEAKVNFEGCIETSEYKKKGSYVYKTPLSLVGTRCSNARIRAYQNDEDDAPIKMNLIDN